MEEYMIWIAGAVGVPLVYWLKDYLKLEGFYAFLLTSAVAVVLALVALFVAGDYSLADFSLDNIANAFAAVIGAATFIYKLLEGAKE